MQNIWQNTRTKQRCIVATMVLATHIKNIQHMGHEGSLGRPTTSKQCVGATRAEGVQGIKKSRKQHVRVTLTL